MPQHLTTALAAALALAAAPAAGSVPARPGAPSPVASGLAAALAVPGCGPRSAAVAVDLMNGRVVYARNRKVSLAPASTEKLALSYALLARLGPEYRLRTTVLGDGSREGATWRGDLILRGAGDPTLSSAGLRRLAAQVRSTGIHRVTGDVVGDESLFDAKRTAVGWKPVYYINESAPLSALTVDGGRYGGRISRDPAFAAATAFRALLPAAGVRVAGKAVTGERVALAELAALDSPPLARILRRVNAESDNLAAELLLKHLGAIVTGRGTTAAGAAAVRAELAAAGISLAGVRIVDGSGLSLRDRLTADALVAILVHAWTDPVIRDALVGSLALSGRRGTLAHRLRGSPVGGRVYAKTGTTAVASALSGYVAGRFAFAVVQNGPPLASWRCRLAQDRFVTVLARQ